MKSISLIISHYNENLNWLKNINDNIRIFLYTKGNQDLSKYEELDHDISIIKLPNIGNEQHTYFTHIVNNYDILDDLMYFIQGTPHEHSILLETKIEDGFIGGLSDFNLKTSVYGNNDLNLYPRHISHKYDGSINYNMVHSTVFNDPWNDQNAINTINFIIDSLPELNIPKENWVFNANGMYGVTKDMIHRLDKSIYEKCLKCFDNTSLNMVAHGFERLNKYIILND